MRAGCSAQRGHAGRHISGHRQDAAETGKVEHFADTRLHAHQHEPAIGIFRRRGVEGDKKSDTRGSDSGHFSKIGQDFFATQLFQLVAFLPQILGIETGVKAAIKAYDANIVDLIQLNEHLFLAQGLWYRTTLDGIA